MIGNRISDPLVDKKNLRSYNRLPLTTYGSVSMKHIGSSSTTDKELVVNSKDDMFLRPSVSIDDFGDLALTHLDNNRLNLITNKVTRTGRQRKKLAARTKGGEFEAKKKKRRVNFCCLCSEIDLESLHDTLIEMQIDGGDSEGNVWETKMYEDVLHIFQTKKPTSTHPTVKLDEKSDGEERGIKNKSRNNTKDSSGGGIGIVGAMDDTILATTVHPFHRMMRSHSLNEQTEFLTEHDYESQESDGYDTTASLTLNSSSSSSSRRRGGGERGSRHELTVDTLEDMSRSIIDLKSKQSTAVLWSTGAREAFIFEFGAVVFWGFPKGEEDDLIELIREYIEQGAIADDEFDEGRDDMAFVTSSGIGQADTDIIIANDVITLPDESTAKSRMSVSFAIAQSAVLNIFEARVETKVKEFKYIPETLADNKALRLTPKKLGTMIGEVYRIRHDVNLHSEILDTPDFFWKEEACEVIYKMTCDYLELKTRTDVLNTRVDMLRELLAVLQQRQDNSSAVKLEWIVIWLIVVSASVEGMAILVNFFLNKS